MSELISRQLIEYDPEKREYRLSTLASSLPVRIPIPPEPDPPDRREDRLRDLTLTRNTRFYKNRRGQLRMADFYTAGWRINGVLHVYYIGRCRSMPVKDAYRKARAMKARQLGIELPEDDFAMRRD